MILLLYMKSPNQCRFIFFLILVCTLHVFKLDLFVDIFRGLIFRSFRSDPTLLLDPQVQKVLAQLIGLSVGKDEKIDPTQVAQVLKV